VPDAADSEHAVIRLDLPAHPRYVSAARVVAASLGAEAGLSVDELDDLRLGVGELVATLIDGAGPEARLGLAYTTNADAVTVTGAISGSSRRAEPDDLTRRILSAVTDTYQLDGGSFSLTKTRGEF
jgi:hypothetical protein